MDTQTKRKKWHDYYIKNQTKIRLKYQNLRLQWKLTVIKAYGGVCTCCGEDKIDFLTLEHTNHDGQKHRKTKAWGSYYKDIINRNFPKEYTILCMNCNWATRIGQICPHKTKWNQ